MLNAGLYNSQAGIKIARKIYGKPRQQTLCDPVDCRPPGSSVHGILQARILECVANPFSRGSSWPRDQAWVSCIAGRFFTIWVTREAESYVFFSSHVWIWQKDHKEDWVLKNWYFWVLVLEKTLESPLDCKEIKPINSKGNQPWIFIGRTDAKTKLKFQYFGHLMRRADSLEKTGKDFPLRQKEREQQWVKCLDRITDNGCAFGQTPGNSEGEGSLVYYSPRDSKELDTTLATEQ